MCLHPNFTTNNPFSALVQARTLRPDYKNFSDGSLQLYSIVRSLTNLPDSRRGWGPGGGGELWPGQQGAGRQPPPVQGDHRAARQNRAGAQPGHHTTIIFSPYTKNNTSDSYKHHSFIFPPTVAYYYQEVNDTVEERVVLEYQLEQLKTIGHSDLSD